MTADELIEQAKAECRPWKAAIIRCAKEYIDANHAVRSNPCGWKACHVPTTDPVWAEYYRLSDEYRKAKSALWMVTDVTYGDDPISNAAWSWRFWKVMAQKCCHYQKVDKNSERAADTMRSLHNAEFELMEACGLGEYYKSPGQYIEATFPNLKKP